MTDPTDPVDLSAAASARDAFLWDPKAPAVDDVVALQRTLASLSAARNPADPPRVVRKPRARQLSIVASLAVAASVAASVAVFVTVRAPDDVVVISDDGARRTVAVGERIDATTAGTTVELGEHGVLTLAAGTQLSVVKNARSAQELSLERGSLSAIVLAPPRFFTVRTQAARAVDMGCAYELAVDDEGTTTLMVTSGFVALEDVAANDGALLDVLVPAGASARARVNARPSLPFRSDATQALRAIVDAAALDVDALLVNVDARDAITLWYALDRVDDTDRARVLERLLALSPPPSSIDVAALRSRDVDALYAWLDVIDDALPAR